METDDRLSACQSQGLDASSILGSISFRGQDRTEAEEFIQAVQEVGLTAEKLQDDAWMAHFASTCILGKALTWYRTLDDDVQKSWQALRTALLALYPPPCGSPTIPIAPSAAVAPPPKTTEPSSPTQPYVAASIVTPSLSHTNMCRGLFGGVSGVIEVRRLQTNKRIGYVSSSLRDNGVLQVTHGDRRSWQKVTVKYGLSALYAGLALDSGPKDENNFIGLTWVTQQGAYAPAASCYAAMTLVQGSEGLRSSINSGLYQGGSEATIWGVATNRLLTAWCPSDGRRLTPFIYKRDHRIIFSASVDGHVAPPGSAGRWEEVNFYFHPESSLSKLISAVKARVSLAA